MVLLKEIDKENDPKRTITEKLNEYTEKTGDLMYLTQRCNYLKAPELTEHEDEKYIEAEISDESCTIPELSQYNIPTPDAIIKSKTTMTDVHTRYLISLIRSFICFISY